MKRLIALLLLLAGCVPPYVPPGPSPPVVVVPVPPVVVPVQTGERIAMIVQETTKQSPQLFAAIANMRDGSAAKYLGDKKHLFYSLDIDQKDEHGQQIAAMARLKPSIGDKPLPVFIIAEKIGENKLGKVLHCESITDSVTADNLIELIKRNGG